MEDVEFYLSISNGDLNSCQSLAETLESADWELTEGCQSWALITEKKLTGEQYDKIAEILKEVK